MSNSTAVCPLPSGRRFTMDQQEIMEFPLVSLGNKIARQVDEDDETRTIAFDKIGWQILQPKVNEKRLPSASYYDVYFGLMFLLRNQIKEARAAGQDVDKTVEFSRYEFLQLIGWVAKGRKNGKPSGRHYKQLKYAVQTMMGTRYWREAEGRSKGFVILQDADIEGDKTGPRPVGEEREKRSYVTFGEKFLLMLAGGLHAVEIDLDIYLSLQKSTTRVLFRTLCEMRHRGIETLTLETLFHRIGSVQKEYLPSRAKKVLADAHHELLLRGVITTEPEYEKIDGVYCITYRFGNPEELAAEEGILIERAVTHQVEEGSARELAVAYPNRLREVLDAVEDGRLEAHSNLGGMINSWTRRTDLPIPPKPAGPDLSEAAYRAWAESERERRLADNPQVNVAALKEQVRSTCEASGIAPTEENLTNLLHLNLNTLLGIPPYTVWREEQRDAA